MHGSEGHSIRTLAIWNGTDGMYDLDIAIGPDGLPRIAYVNAQHGADLVRCTNGSCGASTRSAISFSGTYTRAVSVGVGSDGNALIEGGSVGGGGTLGYLDYVRCRTVDCSSYSQQTVPGSWENTWNVSLNLGPDGFVDMIGMDANGFVNQIKPRKATITVHFSQATRSQDDKLKFPEGYCGQFLGLQSCHTTLVPGGGMWVWAVEMQAKVSDDASKWTPSQTKAKNVSGYYRDAANNLVSFTDNEGSTPDGPQSPAVQQTAGQSKIFWLDAPGHAYLFYPTILQGYPVDSMTSTQTFTSKVCSTVNPKTCASVNWYLKIVVDHGAELNWTKSVAGTGSPP